MLTALDTYSQAKVAEIDPKVLINHNVLWLDITMDNTMHVAGRNGTEKLREDTMALVLG